MIYFGGTPQLNNRILRLAICVVLAFLSTGAKSATIAQSEFAVGPWHGSARTGSEPDSGFAFCTMARSYPNGLELSLARAATGLFLIGVKNPGWHLSDSETPHVVIAVDAAAPRTEDGVRVSSDMMLFPFPQTAGAVYAAMLSGGTELTVAHEAQSWHFDIANSRTAIAELAECVRRHTELADQR